jgi:hypothetical protein
MDPGARGRRLLTWIGLLAAVVALVFVLQVILTHVGSRSGGVTTVTTRP